MPDPPPPSKGKAVSKDPAPAPDAPEASSSRSPVVPAPRASMQPSLPSNDALSSALSSGTDLHSLASTSDLTHSDTVVSNESKHDHPKGLKAKLLNIPAKFHSRSSSHSHEQRPASAQDSHLAISIDRGIHSPPRQPVASGITLSRPVASGSTPRQPVTSDNTPNQPLAGPNRQTISPAASQSLQAVSVDLKESKDERSAVKHSVRLVNILSGTADGLRVVGVVAGVAAHWIPGIEASVDMIIQLLECAKRMIMSKLAALSLVDRASNFLIDIAQAALNRKTDLSPETKSHIDQLYKALEEIVRTMRDLSQKGFLEMFLHQGDTEFKLTEASDALDQCLKRFTLGFELATSAWQEEFRNDCQRDRDLLQVKLKELLDSNAELKSLITFQGNDLREVKWGVERALEMLQRLTVQTITKYRVYEDEYIAIQATRDADMSTPRLRIIRTAIVTGRRTVSPVA